MAALLCAGSMWFYVQRVLIPYQRADAAVHQRPRGNLSDLYPRWLGARELLLHRRNPYSSEITVEIQKGYYGRALDPGRPDDPKDQQGFAYPVYVVFLLAPLIGIRFEIVHEFFFWFLAGLTGFSVWLWLRVLRWHLVPAATAATLLFVLGSFPAVQGIKLQQLSLVAAALLAGAFACISSGWLFCGGMLLALATIKPQLAWLAVGWLLCWAASDWRERRRMIFGFALMMALLLAGAEVVLPGWLRMFAVAAKQYRQYTQSHSVLDQLLPWGYAGKVVAAIFVLVSASFLWKMRQAPVHTTDFGRAAAFVMALTVLVVPMYAPYNQVLLLPAILLLVRDRAILWTRFKGFRLGYTIGAFAVTWQWMISILLVVIYFAVSPQRASDGWSWPFFATFAVPILIFALMLFHVQSIRGEDLS